jgi:hypothetical protein
MVEKHELTTNVLWSKKFSRISIIYRNFLHVMKHIMISLYERIRVF